MKKLLLCTLMASMGYCAGYITHEYGMAKERMTAFADLYDCCAGAARAKLSYSTSAETLAEVAVKGAVKGRDAEPITNLDRSRMVYAWRTAIEPSLAAGAGADWVQLHETEARGKVLALLKGANLDAEALSKLSFAIGPPALTEESALPREQTKQMDYLFSKAPELALLLNAAEKSLTDKVREKAPTSANLAADPMSDTFRSPIDVLALCQVRPELLTLKKGSTMRDCVRDKTSAHLNAFTPPAAR